MDDERACIAEPPPDDPKASRGPHALAGALFAGVALVGLLAVPIAPSRGGVPSEPTTGTGADRRSGSEGVLAPRLGGSFEARPVVAWGTSSGTAVPYRPASDAPETAPLPRRTTASAPTTRSLRHD
jgi:hypothetical protein